MQLGEVTMFNQNFYPTPELLAHRMFDKVDFSKVENILEPSAGKGDLIEALNSYKIKSNLNESMHYHWKDYQISTIEIDPDLQATLVGKKIPVIDDNFLTYSGSTHFDLVMANFPFSDGEHHLTKALDIIFCGQIICLLNAETLRNPCTNTRKTLVYRLNSKPPKTPPTEDKENSLQKSSINGIGQKSCRINLLSAHAMNLS